jgi:hypothetical protein
MSQQLATYLNDHLAGARFAIDMLERLRDTQTDDEFKQFAARMLLEIEADRSVLEQLAEEVGGRNVLKEASAWLAEKASRVKLRLGSEDNLAVFEAIEALSLGVLGKLKLWRALSAIAQNHSLLRGIDFATLIERAQSQHDEIEARRLAYAKSVLIGD